MYDVSHDNTVSKQELTTLLNHIPKEALHHTHPLTPSSNGGGHFPSLPTLSRGNSIVSPSAMEHQSQVNEPETTAMTSLLDHPEVQASESVDVDDVDHYTNQDIVEQAFAECDINHEGRLTYEEFKMWMEKNPSVLEYIGSILPYNGPKDQQPHHHKKETLPHMKRIQSRASITRGTSIQDVAGEIFNHQTGNRRNSNATNSRRYSLNVGHWENGAASPMSPMPGAPLSRNSSFSHPPLPNPNVLNPQARLAHSPSLAESNIDPEEQARFHLVQAYELTQNQELKQALLHILEGLPEGLIAMERHDTSEVSTSAVLLLPLNLVIPLSLLYLLSSRSTAQWSPASRTCGRRASRSSTC